MRYSKLAMEKGVVNQSVYALKSREQMEESRRERRPIPVTNGKQAYGHTTESKDGVRMEEQTKTHRMSQKS